MPSSNAENGDHTSVEAYGRAQQLRPACLHAQTKCAACKLKLLFDGTSFSAHVDFPSLMRLRMPTCACDVPSREEKDDQSTQLNPLARLPATRKPARQPGNQPENGAFAFDGQLPRS